MSDSVQEEEVESGDVEYSVYRALRAQYPSQNLVYGPESLRDALVAIRAGASGKTRDQLHRVLKAGGGTVVENDKQQTDDNTQMVMRQSSHLWVQSGYPIEPPFLNALQSGLSFEVGHADFKTSPRIATQRINQTIFDATDGKIPELFGGDDLDTRTRVVLATALLLNVEWQFPFDPEKNTEDRPFWTSGEDSTPVTLMNQDATVGFAELADCQVLLLPYADSSVKFVIFLPRHRNGLSKLEGDLTRKFVETSLQKVMPVHVQFSIPKFRIVSHLLLEEPLKKVGIVAMFDEEEADFSRICSKEGLYISRMVQHVELIVDESGTEAAAATGAVGTARFGPTQPEKVFVADHPFVFALIDSADNSLLFMGCCAKP